MGSKTVKLSVTVCIIAIICYYTLDMHEVLRPIFGNQCPYHAILGFFPSWLMNQGTDEHSVKDTDTLLTKEELKQYDGTEGSKGLYIAIMGQVFDVSKGERFYGPGNGYGFFAGKDGSRGFVTGQFDDKGLIDDVAGIELVQVIELKNWIEFYHKDYTYVGKVIGNFYDENGQPRQPLFDYQKRVEEANKETENRQKDKERFPPCNSEWKQGAGGRVYCSTKSGGIDRDWVGVPRKYFKAGGKNSRCACVKNTGPPSEGAAGTSNRGDLDNPSLQEYPGCEPVSDSCRLPE